MTMAIGDSLTYSTTKHSVPPALGIGDILDVYGLVNASTTTNEHLIRISTAVKERSSDVLTRDIFEHAYTNLAIIGRQTLDIVQSESNEQSTLQLGSKAIAVANLIDGVIDRDGSYFELSEPFVEVDILRLLYANKRQDRPVDFYLNRLWRKRP